MKSKPTTGVFKGFLTLLFFLLLLLPHASASPDTCSTEGECKLNSSSSFSTTDPKSSEKECSGDVICVVYFYGEGCSKCAELESFMLEFQKKHSNVRVHWLEIYNNKTNYDLYNELTAERGIPIDKRGIPLVVVGKGYLMGVGQIKENLENVVVNYNLPKNFCPLKGRLGCHIAQYHPAELSPAEQIKISIPLIILTGLVDGINPCAFAVLILLLAYINLEAEVRGGKSHMIKIVFLYVSVIYVTYFLAGFGLFKILGFTGLTLAVYKIAAGIAVIAGLINIKDYFWYGRGLTLKISESRANLFRKYMRKASAPATIILGVLVAAFELPCTGGVYLAIIAMMSKSMTATVAVPYLLLYNLMFIAPLLVIFLVAYFGVSPKQLEQWRQTEKKKMKLVMGVVFLGLGLIMLYNIYVGG